ncbi:MAG: EF-P lysine aminoacylase EpmA [Dehalococcoidales bacterium]|nr:EF-P lysine aminoacylase EpmA [Dehalococcoidales bacterium]
MLDEERRRLARVRPNLERRSLIIRTIRSFFEGQGFLEVETPVRIPEIAPEEYIAPFRSEGSFLATSPELHMKRLLAAGYERIFQLSRCFRRGERGRHHNPEFLMLEWYRAGADYRQMIADTELLLNHLAGTLGFKGDTIAYRGQRIDISVPFPRTTVRDAFLKAAGWDPLGAADLSRFDEEFVLKVLPGFPADRPTVLLDYPAELGALARRKPDDPRLAERAEVFIGGLELVNCYSELTDPAEQEARFRTAIARIAEERHETIPLPEKFLGALALLPPCGGAALGVHRLVMLFCDATSIDEVMAFPAENA